MENIKIRLPDGSQKDLPVGSSGFDLAKSIGPGLAKDAVAVTINGEQKDLLDAIEKAERRIKREKKQKEKEKISNLASA